MTHKIFCAGFGGQGIMSIGQLLAYAAMYEDKQVTWCPSYGPEMRGGEANCSVIISDERIGSPLIKGDATVAIFMNVASYRKFINQVGPGGNAYINSSLIHEKVERNDINAYYIPVNDIATDLGNIKLANMVMLGAVNHVEKIAELENIIEAFRKVFGESKEKYIPINIKALKEGEIFLNRTIE